MRPNERIRQTGQSSHGSIDQTRRGWIPIQVTSDRLLEYQRQRLKNRHPARKDRVFLWVRGEGVRRVGLLSIQKSTKVSQRPINTFTKLKIQKPQF